MPRGVYKRTPEAKEKLRLNALKAAEAKKQKALTEKVDAARAYIWQIYKIDNPTPHMIEQIERYIDYSTVIPKKHGQ